MIEVRHPPGDINDGRKRREKGKKEGRKERILFPSN